jgi:coenzyme F420-0:L-glutamate ligase/coenzyme F420-1:gamma-L-glutamate ligase
MALADEVASAAELVMGKTDGVPFAIVRGVSFDAGEGSSAALVRDASEDMFR